MANGRIPMNSPTLELIYDGIQATGYTYRIKGTIANDSLSWDLITDDSKQITVRPLQIPSNKRPFGFPVAINSSLKSAAPLFDLAHEDSFLETAPELLKNLGCGSSFPEHKIRD